MSRPMIVQFPMWDKPPLRANDRRTWQVQHRVRAKAMEEARWAIRAARLTPVAGAEIELHYRVPDRRRRDSDGPEPTKKVVIDALVAEGVLPDDSFLEVPRSSVVIHPPNGQPASIWVELTNVEEYHRSWHVGDA